jgi:peptide/nickel transport system substrate-binding protein
VLADERVRQAITLSLDRQAMALSQFGPYSVVPYGPVSQMLWLGHVSPKAPRQNLARARRLLRDAGWRDSNGDGTLDRGGRPLALSVIVPSSSIMRRDMSVMAQEQLRQVGIKLDVLVLERPVWQERFVSGRFDISFGALRQVPSPSGLTDSWTCAGASNVSHYCDPAVDSLLTSAILTQGDAAPVFVKALNRMEQDAPASFLYAPLEVIAVHKRYEGVELRDGSPWLMLWHWHVRRGQALPRDRVMTH